MTNDELNALAAEKVMGWVSAAGRRQWWFDGTSPMGPFDPLHSIADAMRLVEKLRERDAFFIKICTGSRGFTWGVVMDVGNGEIQPIPEQDMLPRAITLACLKTVGAIP